jgi:hypothetical protein
MRIRMLSTIVLATGLAVVSAVPASADPPVPDGATMTLTCGQDVWSITVAPGHGQWTPAMALEGQTVFIPLTFGAAHGVLYDSEGNVVEEFYDDTVVHKGGGHAERGGKELVDCTYVFTFDEGEFSGVFSGEVTGFTSGR